MHGRGPSVSSLSLRWPSSPALTSALVCGFCWPCAPCVPSPLVVVKAALLAPNSSWFRKDLRLRAWVQVSFLPPARCVPSGKMLSLAVPLLLIDKVKTCPPSGCGEDEVCAADTSVPLPHPSWRRYSWYFQGPCMSASIWTSPCHASSISARASRPPAQTGNLGSAFPAHCPRTPIPGQWRRPMHLPLWRLYLHPFPFCSHPSGGVAGGGFCCLHPGDHTCKQLRRAGAGVTKPEE